MASEAPQPPEKDELAEHIKKIDAANLALSEKLSKDTDSFQRKMEALTGTILSSYPTFQQYVGLGQIVAAVKQSAIDREIIAAYLAALVSAGTADKADAIRSAVRKLVTPS